MAETEFGSQMSEQDSRFQEGARKISQAASETWDQTRQRAGVVRERTEVFLRENPVPTVLGALCSAWRSDWRFVTRRVRKSPLYR